MYVRVFFRNVLIFVIGVYRVHYSVVDMEDKSERAVFCAEEHAHQRFNPMLDEWVLVSPHRARRPWAGQTERAADTTEHSTESSITHSNPLCPGVTRANGQVNSDYMSTYVFPNDFPALMKEVPEDMASSVPAPEDPLFQCRPARGECKVMCFHPDSNKIIPLMTFREVEAIITTWAEQFDVLGKEYQWVQIFENRGAAMGCSNSHPHCQIWASAFLPSVPRRKDEMMRRYCLQHKSVMLLDYLQRELHIQKRVVCSNSAFVVVVPYWAVWPYETLVLPRRHVLRLNQLTADEMRQLAQLLQQLLTRYDNLFSCSFPYSMGWHGAPTGDLASSDNQHWQLHGVYYPPLLRSAEVKKFMVGYEMLAQAQRDISPEMAAEQLRNSPDVHYSLRQ